jgi:dTDP-4-dehydrorhamnose 3,5-epimerase
MHFQTAPHAQDKMVYVVAWNILDVVLDINPGSPTYWKFESFHLSSENNQALFIPKWYAHGFTSQSEESITSYMITAGYAPENDTGINWDSFWFDWGIENPIVSEKDQNLINFWVKEFNF